MNFLAAWILAPIALFFLSLGLGLLIHNRRSAAGLSLAQLVGMGFALMVAIGSFLIEFKGIARFTTIAVSVLALIGLVLGRKKIRNFLKRRYELFVLTSSFILAGLPVLTYRKISWPGWVQLDDTATFLAITDWIMSKGRSLPEKLISTNDRVIQVVLGGSFYGTYDANTNSTAFDYPVGSLIPLGVTGRLLNIDLAWIYFPYLAFCLALTALLFYSFTNTVFNRKWVASLVAITSASASTYYAYALWGGIKELSLVPVLTLSILLLSKLKESGIRNRDGRNTSLLYLLSAGAIYALAGKSGFGFILGELALFTLFYFVTKRFQFSVRKSLIALVAVLILLYLTKDLISNFFNKYLIPEIPDSGNLARPVNMLQVLGIWPSGDFRGDIYWQPYSYLALAIVIALLLLGLWSSFKTERLLTLIGVVLTFAIVIYSSIFSGIWLTGKAIAVASPFFLLTAFIGVAQLRKTKRLRFVATLSLTLLVLGVGTSNYLGYRHTWLAPSEKVQELAQIGKRFKDQGPALMTDYSVIGARYLLRNLQAESASELRVNLIPMRDGSELQKGFAADIDLFENSEISKYPLLVLKHTAAASRPLFNYDLAFEGKYYDVWKINEKAPKNIESIGFGTNYVPAGAPSCKFLKNQVKDVSGKVYSAIRTPVSLVDLSEGQLPTNWRKEENAFGAVTPGSGGTITSILEVYESGDFQLFLSGSFGGKLTLTIDSKEVFRGKTFFEGNRFLSNYLTTTKLSAGKHLLQVTYSKPLLSPGAGVIETLGPIYLTTETAAKSKVVSLPAESINELCGKNLDWLAWVK